MGNSIISLEDEKVKDLIIHERFKRITTCSTFKCNYEFTDQEYQCYDCEIRKSITREDIQKYKIDDAIKNQMTALFFENVNPSIKEFIVVCKYCNECNIKCECARKIYKSNISEDMMSSFENDNTSILPDRYLFTYEDLLGKIQPKPKVIFQNIHNLNFPKETQQINIVLFEKPWNILDSIRQYFNKLKFLKYRGHIRFTVILDSPESDTNQMQNLCGLLNCDFKYVLLVNQI